MRESLNGPVLYIDYKSQVVPVFNKRLLSLSCMINGYRTIVMTLLETETSVLELLEYIYMFRILRKSNYGELSTLPTLIYRVTAYQI